MNWFVVCTFSLAVAVGVPGCDILRAPRWCNPSEQPKIVVVDVETPTGAMERSEYWLAANSETAVRYKHWKSTIRGLRVCDAARTELYALDPAHDLRVLFSSSMGAFRQGPHWLVTDTRFIRIPRKWQSSWEHHLEEIERMNDGIPHRDLWRNSSGVR